MNLSASIRRMSRIRLHTLLLAVAILAMLFTSWRWWFLAENARRHIRTYGGVVEWIDRTPVTPSYAYASEEYKHWRAVIGSDWMGGDAGLRLLHRIDGLRALSINAKSGVTSRALSYICQCGELEVLEIYGMHLDDGSTATLDKLSRLRRLKLANCIIADGSLSPLPRLRRLKYVELWGSEIGKSNLAFLGPEVVSLGLRDTSVTDEALAELPGLSHLASVNATGTGLTDEGILVLLKMPELRELDVSNTRVTRDGIERFRRRSPRTDVIVTW